MYKHLHIGIVNYGDYSTKNIIKYCDNIGIKTIILNPDSLPPKDITHIILSGGPRHIYDSKDKIPSFITNITQYNILAICYGAQLMAYNTGGKVKPLSLYEKGYFFIIDENDRMMLTWMNRGDYIVKVNHSAIIRERSFNKKIARYDMFYGHNKCICVQYHPENPKCIISSLFREFFNM